jgi:hypothetical protein
MHVTNKNLPWKPCPCRGAELFTNADFDLALTGAQGAPENKQFQMPHADSDLLFMKWH